MTPTTTDAATANPPSQELHSRAEHILLPGLGLGIAGDYLLRNGPLGPGLLLWLSLLTAAALWLTRNAGAERRRTLMLWSAIALGAALLTVMRSLEALIPAMLLVILACAVLTALATTGIPLRAARVRDYFFTGFTLPLQMLTQTPRLLKQADLGAVAHDKQIADVVRGVVIAVPVLLVFGALFASADAGFSRYAGALTHIVSPDLPQQLLLILVFTWIGTSLLAIGCRKAGAMGGERLPSAQLKLGQIEMHVVLALVSTLFVAFVALQLGYLFGGSEFIVSTSGLTVAEYARRGFFELLIIVTLTIGLLLVLDATDGERPVLRRYGSVLIVCVFFILASAIQRLFLYTEAFGLTLSRFNALAMMLWQVFNVLSFAFTVLRGNVRGFASALAISGVATLLLLALVNPAAIVARINLDRTIQDGRPLDVFYLTQLSSDAVPPVLDRISALPAKEQCDVARYLLNAYPVAADGTTAGNQRDWRRWNASYSTARRIVGEHAEALFSMTGLPRTGIRITMTPGSC